jgi:hypothetical protein
MKLRLLVGAIVVGTIMVPHLSQGGGDRKIVADCEVYICNDSTVLSNSISSGVYRITILNFCQDIPIQLTRDNLFVFVFKKITGANAKAFWSNNNGSCFDIALNKQCPWFISWIHRRLTLTMHSSMSSPGISAIYKSKLNVQKFLATFIRKFSRNDSSDDAYVSLLASHSRPMQQIGLINCSNKNQAGYDRINDLSLGSNPVPVSSWWGLAAGLLVMCLSVGHHNNRLFWWLLVTGWVLSVGFGGIIIIGILSLPPW